jgi:hypothetical protein
MREDARPHRAVARLRLAGGAPPPEAALALEFPTIVVESTRVPGSGDAVIDARLWRLAESFRAFDHAVARAESDAIAIALADREDGAAVAWEVLTRYQRFLGRRNGASRTALFDRVLAVHAGLHDASKPLVLADLAHAVDAWQWLLRLEPTASLAVQLATLFHDIERLESEADRRVEHHAPDYARFKAAHARRGADRTREVLRAAGVDGATAARAGDLVAAHERRGGDVEVDLLNDADALSFFSLNSAGYADYFGVEQTRKKIRYTLARLGPPARRRLARVRLRTDVERLLDAEDATFLGERPGDGLAGPARGPS